MKTQEQTSVVAIKNCPDDTVLMAGRVRPSSPKSRGMLLANCGFTLIELLMVFAILAVLTTVAIQAWPMLKDVAKRGRAIAELHNIATAIEAYQADKGVLPPGPNLGEVGFPSPFLDPWGTPYRYRPLTNAAGTGTPGYSRKDGVGELLNEDYDLFSEGPDRTSAEWITDALDDVVRAASGSFLGEAAKFSP